MFASNTALLAGLSATHLPPYTQRRHKRRRHIFPGGKAPKRRRYPKRFFSLFAGRQSPSGGLF
jgi:hypothetical protein